MKTNNDCTDWSAIYLPARPTGKTDPSRSGFSTKELAQEYVFSQMCGGCKNSRNRFMNGEFTDLDDEDPCMEYPACSCEWAVLPTHEFLTSNTQTDVLKAAGW